MVPERLATKLDSVPEEVFLVSRYPAMSMALSVGLNSSTNSSSAVVPAILISEMTIWLAAAKANF